MEKEFKPTKQVSRGLYMFSRTAASIEGPITISMKNISPFPSGLIEVEGKKYLIQGGHNGTTILEITNEAHWMVVSDDIKMKEEEYDIKEVIIDPAGYGDDGNHYEAKGVEKHIKYWLDAQRRV